MLYEVITAPAEAEPGGEENAAGAGTGGGEPGDHRLRRRPEDHGPGVAGRGGVRFQPLEKLINLPEVFSVDKNSMKDLSYNFV